MQGELISDGKKYISASRASKLCGYNSDYIGQLCRKGALDCKMVGRSWFVEEESLKNHKVVASSTPRGRIPIYQKNNAQNSSQNSGVTAVNLSPEINHSFHSIQQEWQSFINEPEDNTQTLHFAQKLIAGVALLVLLVVGSSALVVNKFAVVTNTSSVLQGKNISSLKNTFMQTSQVVLSSGNNTKESISYSANVLGSAGLSLGQIVDGFVQSAYRGFVFANNFLFDASRKVRVLVMNAGINSNVRNSAPERTGVAVLPSANSDAENEIVKKYVTDSFSDEANIVPDPSGNSGLIKPVFKENKDQEYLYVIVPVKENKN